MQPTLCSKCHKNIAVIFVSRIENGETTNEGLCLKCARSWGLPMDDMMKRMGISDEDLDTLNNEMLRLNSGEGIEDLVPRTAKRRGGGGRGQDRHLPLPEPPFWRR